MWHTPEIGTTGGSPCSTKWKCLKVNWHAHMCSLHIWLCVIYFVSFRLIRSLQFHGEETFGMLYLHLPSLDEGRLINHSLQKVVLMHCNSLMFQLSRVLLDRLDKFCSCNLHCLFDQRQWFHDQELGLQLVLAESKICKTTFCWEAASRSFSYWARYCAEGKRKIFIFLIWRLSFCIYSR